MTKARSIALGSVLSVACAVAARRGDRRHTHQPGAGQDNFFVTWEIQSQALGRSTASRRARRRSTWTSSTSTPAPLRDSFDCGAYQGTSGPVDVGNFDVLFNLTDSRAA